LGFVLHMSRFFGNLVGVSGVPLLSDDWVGLPKLYNDHHLHWPYVFTATPLKEAFVERVPLRQIFRDALTEFMSPQDRGFFNRVSHNVDTLNQLMRV
jgi:hypothetical protein